MRKELPIGLLVLLLVVLLFPYLLSVPPFKTFLVSKFEAKINAKIEINKLQLSWLGPQQIEGIHIVNQQLDGHLDAVVLKTPFWKIASQPYSFTVSNGNFQVRSSKGSIEQIHAAVEQTNVQATGITTANGIKGSFIVQGTAVTAEQFDLAFSADSMPTDPFDCLLGFKGDLTAVLGSSFNIKGSLANHSNEGSFIANLSSVTAQASVQAIFTPTSVTLTAPFSANGPIPLSIRTELAKKGISLKDPVSIQVANDSFYMSRPFALDTLQISSASVNLGRIAVQKPAKFDSIATFLKMPQLSNPNQLDIWLTPADFSLQDGLVQLERVDFFLAQSLHLCCWGQMDLSKERLSMTLGIPADALAQTGLLSNIPSDYVLQVPVSGTFENPKFDTKTAALQIAGAFASDQVQKVGGGLSILGDLVGKTVNTITQPNPTPPQRYQLPWQ
jgi:hypothetical protein